MDTMSTVTHCMPVSDVARRLGIGNDRVRRLDEVLQPIRLSNGHRRYDPSLVEREAAKRGR